ncbi:MAG TPA: DJ-1/PfpI family protein [Polyangiaceae bacterium]|jgi:4-methyl-5(b-hydroxyethyl)-thiazole monophosphate biosynthesis|nr:MAG: Chaperone protein YajL [Deltaproteobacteria bacterium ADurb.Bin207]HNS95585.1 DJ-1/PfpI family protein [Polyangiaceae bacterium]HNZ21356.1 DJ-1/PfpI family protein [Polyangiaceae bacterium]HOD24799.1 DJ-1/PfpI family protein [Polyangiaceae bacterium]HOE47469.1 DJ-1/PfpI family protein [Polyangiaceae bacterium]
MDDLAVAVPLMEGFEEIEAVTIIDVLRRANIKVIVAAKAPGLVTGAHDIGVQATDTLRDLRPESLAAIVLPGGMPGAKNLANDERVQWLVEKMAQEGKLVAAICAAPMAIASTKAHLGRKMTAYPGFETYLEGATVLSDRVVVDANMVTSRGPGTALDFALTLVEKLRDQKTALDLRKKMLVG